MPMSQVDYTVIDMPTKLGRLVQKQDPFDPEVWIRDEDWYDQTRKIYGALVNFFADNGLIAKKMSIDPIDVVVIKLSDLTDKGQALVQSGADDRWLASFDRVGSTKSPSDTTSLKKALSKIGVSN